MTTPITPPSTQSPIATSIAVGAQALVDNADRLGLTWTLSLATVTQDSGTGPKAIIDGDTVALDMVSMIGRLIPGQRVYVLRVPPSGNFIAGAFGIPSNPSNTLLAQLTGVGPQSSLVLTIPLGIKRVRLGWEAILNITTGGGGETLSFTVPGATGYTYNFTTIVTTITGGRVGAPASKGPIGLVNATTTLGHTMVGAGTTEFDFMATSASAPGVYWTSTATIIDVSTFLTIGNNYQGFALYATPSLYTAPTTLTLSTDVGNSFSGTFRLEGWF